MYFQLFLKNVFGGILFYNLFRIEFWFYSYLDNEHCDQTPWALISYWILFHC